MHIKDRMLIVYIIKKCMSLNKKTNNFYLPINEFKYIIAYCNFLSMQKYEYNLFEGKVLKEITLDKIDSIIEEITKNTATEKQLTESISKEDLDIIKTACKYYILSKKPFVELKKEYGDFFRSIIKCFRK